MRAMIDAEVYGKALFELAAESGTAAKINSEIEDVCRLLKENDRYCTLVDSPAISFSERLALLSEAFEGSVDPYLMNFMSILCRKHSMYKFAKCAEAYSSCYRKISSTLPASVSTAVPLSERQYDALKKKLESITGKEVLLEASVDESLIGGVVLRYGGIQLQDSIKSRLDDLRRSLRETTV